MTSWADRFKFGSMRGDDELAQDLTSSIHIRGGSTYDNVVRSVVTSIVMKFMIGWYRRVIEKYTEPEYHTMIHNPACIYTNWSTGEKYSAEFDFLLDWQENHRGEFNKFIRALRAIRSKIDFDVNEIVYKTVSMIQTDAGWHVYPEETMKFREAIESVKAIIYS